ncbi:MAG: hypothetical protein WBG71_06360 [Leeuwenhoekiella sp.]
MKKKLKSDLVSLAHRILKMDADPDYASMQHEAKKLYDKLTVLTFTDAHFEGVNPTIGKQQIIEAIEQKSKSEVEEILESASDNILVKPVAPNEIAGSFKEPELRVETDAERVNAIAKANEELFERMQVEKNKRFKRTSSNTGSKKENQHVLHEPVIEKIKDMVAQMPPEADAIDEIINKITNKPEVKPEDEVADFGKLAEFETPKSKPEFTPRKNAAKKPEKSRLNIGLNDKLAFIKHLFNGSQTDYNRIVSQLNTQPSADEALTFIETMVKPDYNNWEGKELYENRFTQLVGRQLER